MIFDAVFPKAVATWGKEYLPLRIINTSHWETEGLISLVEEYLEAVEQEGGGRVTTHTWAKSPPITIVFTSQRKVNPLRHYAGCTGSIPEGDTVLVINLVHPETLQVNPVEQLVAALDGPLPAPMELPTAVARCLSGSVSSIYGWRAGTPFMPKTVLMSRKTPAAKRPKWLTGVQTNDRLRRQLTKVNYRLHRATGFMQYAAYGIRTVRKTEAKCKSGVEMPSLISALSFVQGGRDMSTELEARWVELHNLALAIMED
jgi:hypothetical protein